MQVDGHAPNLVEFVRIVFQGFPTRDRIAFLRASWFAFAILRIYCTIIPSPIATTPSRPVMCFLAFYFRGLSIASFDPQIALCESFPFPVLLCNDTLTHSKTVTPCYSLLLHLCPNKRQLADGTVSFVSQGLFMSHMSRLLGQWSTLNSQPLMILQWLSTVNRTYHQTKAFSWS